MKGGPWTGHTLKHILCSEAALGYLMHGGRPVLGADGRPVRIAEPLWDRATHDALVTATAPKRDGMRAPKGMRLLTGAAFCGNCGARLHVTGRGHPGTRMSAPRGYAESAPRRSAGPPRPWRSRQPMRW